MRVIRKFYPKSVLLLTLLFIAGHSFGQLPTTGLSLWLRADSGLVSSGGVVTAWNDISGSLNNTSQTSVANQPTLVPNVPLLNNKPSVKFDGLTQYLTGNPIPGLGTNCGLYVFVVCKADGAQAHNHGGIFAVGNTGSGFTLERAPIANLGELFLNNNNAHNCCAYMNNATAMPNTVFPYKIFDIRKVNAQSVQLDTNTFAVTSTLTDGLTVADNNIMKGTFTNDTFHIGYSERGLPDGIFNGEIAEVLVYNACLTGTQIQQVQTYLLNRYAPVANLGQNILDTTNLCAVAISPGNNYKKYQWSNGQTTDTIFVHAGTFSVTTTDVFNFTSNSTITVAYPDSLPHTANVCQNGSIQIVPYTSSLVSPTFLWNNGQTTSTINVSAAGNYWVTVTDNHGCSLVLDTVTVVMDVFASTVSLANAPSLCSGNHLTLHTPATGWGNLGFHWSTGSNVSFTDVTASGPYSVTVTDGGGCSGSASTTVTVTGVAPHVNFSSSIVCAGFPFTPFNLSDSLGVTSYHWDFGDGDTSIVRFPSHTFASPGTYQVHLTLTTSGCSNDTTIPVTVNIPPTAAFQTGEACLSNPQFTFIDLSTAAGGQLLTYWSWQFGDLAGGTSTMQSPTHGYIAQADTYTVTLTVTQTNGCKGSVSNLFVIVPEPALPTTPILEFPVNNSVASGDSITFGWQSVPGAAYYRLAISTNPSLGGNDSIYLNLHSNQKTVVLPVNQTYYWQVTAYNACTDQAVSVTNTFRQFVPDNLTTGNLALWLKADAGVITNAQGVSQWSDSSGNHYDATASNGLIQFQQPSVHNSVALINHKPSVQFNGTSNYMTGPVINGMDQSSISIFIVAKANGAQPNGEPAGMLCVGDVNCGMFTERNGGNGFEFVNDLHCSLGGYPQEFHDANSMPPGVACPYHIYGVVKTLNVSAIIDTNGVFAIPNAQAQFVSPFTNDVYYLGHMSGTDPFGGNVPYGFLNGEIAEVIVYNSSLSSDQQKLVNNYLFDKYAPPVNLGPDIVQNYKLCPITLRTGSRFAKYKWSTGATSDTLNVSQSGIYAVTTVDVFNRISWDSINITMPYAGSHPDTDYVCFGDTGQIVQLINNPSAYSYVWYDSTSPSSVVNLNVNANFINPFTAGYYYTKITDTTNAHCSIITKKVPLFIDTFYHVQLLPLFDTICKNGTLTILPLPLTIDSFLWTPIAFPMDTTSAPTVSLSQTYYLYTVDNHGCKNYDSSQVFTRAQAPVANFTVPNLCLANTTTFINTSTPAINGDQINGTYWNYGGGIPAMDTASVKADGQTSYRINYGYGSYTVSLTVTTDSGCFAIKTEHINILPAPHAGYIDSANNSVYPYILCAGAGSSLQLTDTSSVIGGSAIARRYWRINGVTDADTGRNIQYTFPTQGVYNIMLEVINSLGCADSITQQIHVNPPFIAKLSVQDNCLGDPTTFKDLTQSLSEVSRIWKFRQNGDGPYAYTQTAQFEFSPAGTYDVELQVQNAIGCISTLDTLVKIVNKPVANFYGLIGCEGRFYSPIDTSISLNPVDHWHWDIGGRISNLKRPRVVFADTGAFNVSLTVTNQEGCVDSITKVIEVGAVPTALFSYTPLYGTAPLLVTFTNRSIGAVNYIWNFGDGSSTPTSIPQINPPPHNYVQDNNYNVTLYAYSNCGCYDSLERTVYVMPTNLDLGLTLVMADPVAQPDGSELVTVTAYIANLGTRIITSAQLYATLGSKEVFEQNWTGFLLSGQTVVNTFPAQFVVDQGYTNTFVCVTAKNVNDGETETDTTNNQECTSLTTTMQLAGPSPNPAGANCQLGIILPQAGTVYITVYDMLGQPVIPEFSMDLPAERTNYDIPVKQFEASEYYIRVRYKNDSQVRSFVISK